MTKWFSIRNANSVKTNVWKCPPNVSFHSQQSVHCEWMSLPSIPKYQKISLLVFNFNLPLLKRDLDRSQKKSVGLRSLLLPHSCAVASNNFQKKVQESTRKIVGYQLSQKEVPLSVQKYIDVILVEQLF